MTRNIYLVQHNGYFVYDSYDSHVVVADTPAEAREMCADIAADEGFAIWAKARVTKVGTTVGRKHSRRIILSSFNAG